MEDKIFKVKCPNCGGNTRLWGKKNSYNLLSCISCKLIFVNPLPNTDSIYNQDYFFGAKSGFGYVNYDSDKEPMIPTFNKYIDLFSKLGYPSGSIFDIGAATGFFLEIAKKRGYGVSGVEKSEHATQIAKNKGINVYAGDIMSLNLADNSFDIVTMFDVLEHMPNPFTELMKIKKILKPNGLLVINSPNGQSFLAKFLKSKWHLVVPPEHIFYFSPQNLSLFLKKNGFEVVYNKTIGKRFSFQYIFKMLYVWQKFPMWKYLSDLFSIGFLSHLYIPVNLHDNFFMIFQKK